LAESWSVSDDGLVVRLRLRAQSAFHDGKAVTADAIRGILEGQLPRDLWPVGEDVISIRATSERDIEFSLKRRSTFLMERLDAPIPGPGSTVNGAGPFYVSAQGGSQIEMRPNGRYFAPVPAIDRIVIKPYTSVRAAWADLLRNQVDMLYDVGVDALDSLASSSDVRIYTFQRGYQYLLVFNLRKPYLKSAELRRLLNVAIDRDELVRDVLAGHGVAADGAVWPRHWAYTSDLPRFAYQPRAVDSALKRQLVCIFNEPAYERLALVVQKQLQAVGIDLDLKLVTGSDFTKRLSDGDFDLFLSDFAQGPNMVRPYVFWHTAAPFNFGQFSSPEVDSALDAIRRAPDDSSYKAGVAAFQRAMYDDPPAVFLAWRERARVVSRRFEIQTEPNVDILTALHLWRPAPDERTARSN
jgi:peptide/nickel transport system substrate-binding protein